eukprot:745737-Pyramimonas_sp.AAC.1
MGHRLPARLAPGDAHGADDEPEASKEVGDLARALGAAPANDANNGTFIASWAIAWQRRCAAPWQASVAGGEIVGTEWRPWRSASSRRAR